MRPSEPGGAQGLLCLCLGLISATAWIVPAPQRRDWSAEWSAEVLHQWRWLDRAGELSTARMLGLALRCCGVLPDAAWLRARDWRTEMLLGDLRYAVRMLAK